MWRGLLAGIAAVLLSRWVNGWLAGRAGRWAPLPGALAEEIWKTGLALLAGGPILLAHVVFGGAELARDVLARPGRGWRPGLAGMGGHLLFGLAAAMAGARWGAAGALAAGVALHLAWNGLALWLNRGGGVDGRPGGPYNQDSR